MIDIHCHYLPGVDDGAADFAESLEMVRLAYEDGIRTIIVTPHVNHPMDFPKTDHQKVFEELEKVVKASYSDMKLFLAAENYISKDMIHHLDKIDLRTIHNSRYLLIEFNTQIRFQDIDNACHELSLLGYLPILAHAENYYCLQHNYIERIRLLKKEGVLIQTNATSLLGSSRNKRNRYAKLSLKHQLTDLVASDGHNTTSRKPDLMKAYRFVKRSIGQEAAERLFKLNQEAILSDASVLEPDQKKFRIHRFCRLCKHLFLMLTLVTGLILGLFYFQPNIALTFADPEKVTHFEDTNIQADDREETSSEDKDTEIDNTNQETSAESDELTENSVDSEQEELTSVNENNVSEGNDIIGTVTDPITPDQGLGDRQDEQSTDQDEQANEQANEQDVDEAVIDGEVVEEIPSYEEVVVVYQSELTSLQDIMMGKVSAYSSSLKSALSIKEENERNETLISIRDMIYGDEAQADAMVNTILYNLQNELEEYGYDTEVVDKLRDEYLAVKEAQTDKYLAELSEYYSSMEGN